MMMIDELTLIQLRRFIKASRGNWHNAVYIECGVCLTENKRCGAPDFLYVPDYDGRPVLIPRTSLERFLGEPVQKDECFLELSRVEFERLYKALIEDRVDFSAPCSLFRLIEQERGMIFVKNDNEK